MDTILVTRGGDDGFPMGKEKSAADASFLQGLFRTDLYKRAQGRVARQVTGGVLAVIVFLGAYQLLQSLIRLDDVYRFGICGSVLVVSLWLIYRLVNYPRFADFLIAVEAEMNKVSWPTRTELWRSSLVVIVVIFVLAAVLFMYDIFWVKLFDWLLGIAV